MNVKRKKRLAMVTTMIVGVGLTVSLVLFALNKNINLYYTPSQLNDKYPANSTVRIGGLVKNGSLRRTANSLKMTFIVTDFKKEVKVRYNGIVPSLFREGQGVVVEGQFDQLGFFNASQVLAKHDEKYMPPGIKSV